MLRRALISTLCLAIAFLGVAGLHVHVPEGGAEHGHESHSSGHVHTTSILDSDHGDEHRQHGDIDVEPMVKAFGKLSLDQLTPAAILLFVLVALLAATTGTLIARTPLLRPPSRLLPFFLPPPHAPPATA